ncbi:MAG: hypothetical protein NZ958_02950 [Bacteroidia bacterium]|nr:hypothetical protein [Bacteroidia bacterium]MDW8089622.1 hypothetical protein [Bacteroidia bacterium]
MLVPLWMASLTIGGLLVAYLVSPRQPVYAVVWAGIGFIFLLTAFIRTAYKNIASVVLSSAVRLLALPALIVVGFKAFKPSIGPYTALVVGGIGSFLLAEFLLTIRNLRR